MCTNRRPLLKVFLKLIFICFRAILSKIYLSQKLCIKRYNSAALKRDKCIKIVSAFIISALKVKFYALSCNISRNLSVTKIVQKAEQQQNLLSDFHQTWYIPVYIKVKLRNYRIAWNSFHQAAPITNCLSQTHIFRK